MDNTEWIIYFTYLTSCLLLSTSTASFEISRKKSGDELTHFRCNKGGTIIVMEDSTHSLACANTLAQAGCDLEFKTTKKTMFIHSDILNQRFIITTSSGNFCPDEHTPVVGQLLVQDYPTNIYADVWSKDKGALQVNNTFQFDMYDKNKLEVVATVHWSGILVKLFIDCFNQYGARLMTQSSARRCVTVKFAGNAKYPMSKEIFTNTQPWLPTVTTQKARRTVVAAAVKSDMGNPFAWAIALSIALGIIVLLFCAGIWVIYDKCRKRKQQHLAINDLPQVADSRRSNVTRLSYNQMEMSPIINVDTNRPISQVITIEPSHKNYRRSSKPAMRVSSRSNVATIHLNRNHAPENSNNFIESKYIPPYEFYDEEYFFEKSISSKVDNDKGKINRGKIRRNIQEFDAFESPMGEENLKDMIQNTPNHQKSINALISTPVQKSKYPARRRENSGSNIFFSDDDDENLPSGTREIIAEINRAYSSFEETLQREQDNLRSTEKSQKTPFEIDDRTRNDINYSGSALENQEICSPSNGDFDGSSEAIDAMFDLQAYDNESSMTEESVQVEMEISAEDTLSKNLNEEEEEYMFQPYALLRDRTTSNPLSESKRTTPRRTNSSRSNIQWTKFGEGSSNT